LNNGVQALPHLSKPARKQKKWIACAVVTTVVSSMLSTARWRLERPAYPCAFFLTIFHRASLPSGLFVVGQQRGGFRDIRGACASYGRGPSQQGPSDGTLALRISFVDFFFGEIQEIDAVGWVCIHQQEACPKERNSG